MQECHQGGKICNMTPTPEQRLKYWALRKERYESSGVKNLSEFKKKQSVIAINRCNTPQYKIKIKEFHSKESYKKNVSESAKQAYINNPELRKTHTDILNTPETISKIIKNKKSLEGRKKNSLGMLLKWEDTNYRENVIRGCKDACKNPEVMERKIKAIKEQIKYDTTPERILKSIVESLGYIYISQYPIGTISCVDGFVKPNCVFYADGNYYHGSHFPKTQEKDIKQTNLLVDLGYIVFRFWEKDLKYDPEKIKESILCYFDTIGEI
jgi:hypothetical protein